MSEEDYATYPAWLRLRAVRVTVRQRGFRTKRLVLVTTLLDAEAVTREDLADLYRRRWQAEIFHPDHRPSNGLYVASLAA
jgi:hypothetical protein